MTFDTQSSSATYYQPSAWSHIVDWDLGHFDLRGLSLEGQSPMVADGIKFEFPAKFCFVNATRTLRGNELRRRLWWLQSRMFRERQIPIIWNHDLQISKKKKKVLGLSRLQNIGIVICKSFFNTRNKCME